MRGAAIALAEERIPIPAIQSAQSVAYDWRGKCAILIAMVWAEYLLGPLTNSCLQGTFLTRILKGGMN